MLEWLSVWSEVQTCMWPSWYHCHSLSLASVKSRLVFTFLVPAHPDSPGKRVVKWVCVCVAVLKVIQRSVVKLSRAADDTHDSAPISCLLGWCTAAAMPIGIKLRLLQLLSSVEDKVCKVPVFFCCCYYFNYNITNWLSGCLYTLMCYQLSSLQQSITAVWLVWCLLLDLKGTCDVWKTCAIFCNIPLLVTESFATRSHYIWSVSNWMTPVCYVVC